MSTQTMQLPTVQKIITWVAKGRQWKYYDLRFVPGKGTTVQKNFLQAHELMRIASGAQPGEKEKKNAKWEKRANSYVYISLYSDFFLWRRKCTHLLTRLSSDQCYQRHIWFYKYSYNQAIVRIFVKLDCLHIGNTGCTIIINQYCY